MTFPRGHIECCSTILYVYIHGGNRGECTVNTKGNRYSVGEREGGGKEGVREVWSEGRRVGDAVKE